MFRFKIKKGFTLIELLVVIAIIALLMSILLPSLNKVKQMARTLVCKANLHNYGLAFAGFLAENNDKYFNFGNTNKSHGWKEELQPYFEDSPQILLCTEAKKEIPAGTLPKDYYFDITNYSYGLPYDWNNYTNGFNDSAPASYGINHFVMNPPDRDLDGNIDNGDASATGGYSKAFYWRRPQGANNSTIPVFGDAWVKGAWIDHIEGSIAPPESRGSVEGANQQYGIPYVALDRHHGKTNWLFMDSTVREVGIKELWTLKWHRQFDTRNDWTLEGNNGNVSTYNNRWETDAPWLKGYKNY